MKKTIIILLLIAGTLLVGVYAKRKFYNTHTTIESVEPKVIKTEKKEVIKDGDIIFQTSLSQQSKAIQLATKSKYSHCGLIYKEGNTFFVFEAIQPVTKTPLNKWIARGEDSHYVIKRLKNAERILTAETLQKMRKIGQTFIGKDYDPVFDWSDEKIYCSELIWKIYQRGAGIEIGKLQQLKDFDLNNNIVKKKLKERYGSSIPLHETVISPASIFKSDLLTTISEN
ncbi:MAG: YiiX family permuted papain-like enzyme [Agriterribacter sp.]